MKEGRRERRAKQSHPFLIKAVAPNFVGLRDKPAQAHTLASSFATPQVYPRLGILAVSYRAQYGRPSSPH